MPRQAVGLLAMTVVAACHALVEPASAPAGQQDPTVYNTPSGAQQQARGALNVFRETYVTQFAMTDESQAWGDVRGVPGYASNTGIDQRRTGDNVNDFAGINRARLFTNLAQAALAKFATETPAVLRAEVLAAQGYSELQLADEYCSGIPLSTIDFEQNFHYAAGSRTLEVYAHATQLFAQALPLAAGNDSIVTMARVGWGRALLAQAKYDSAAAVVATIPTASTYAIKRISLRGIVTQNGGVLGDREGINGLPYVSSFDPRIVTQRIEFYYGQTSILRSGYVLAASLADDSIPVPIASGVEARLIQAEAVLQRTLHTHAASDVAEWLDSLNALRTTGERDGTAPLYYRDSTQDPNTGSYTVDSTLIRIDTLWRAGSGGVARLGPLSDPGATRSAASADSARIALMFKERAFWLFLRGQRQGDLRRLIRQYHWRQDQVYPIGPYPYPEWGGGLPYGSDVNIAVVDDGNPSFRGCFDRGA